MTIPSMGFPMAPGRGCRPVTFAVRILLLCLAVRCPASAFVPRRGCAEPVPVQLIWSRRPARSHQRGLITAASLAPSLPFPVRVTVMGGGNFGLAIASVLGRKGVPTTLLVRSEEVAEQLNSEHRHPRYMTDIKLPRTVFATADPESALSDASYVVHAVPVQFSRDFLMAVRDHVPPNAPVVSASKGIETSSLGFMADILSECLGTQRSYAFLSGPSFAREICEGAATAVVVASADGGRP